MPAFVVFSSAIVFFFLSFISHKNKEIAKKIYNDQLTGVGSKIFSIIIMAIGIFILNL
jgi:hypothetical protein